MLQAMSCTLRHDIYSLAAPGISINQVKMPVPDPLAIIQYSCLYWVDHLLECDSRGIIHNNLKDGRSVHKFLYQSLLYWLKVLSLIRSLSNGVVMIRKLEDRIQVSFRIILSNF